jgi:hypothetical protein
MTKNWNWMQEITVSRTAADSEWTLDIRTRLIRESALTCDVTRSFMLSDKNDAHDALVSLTY